MLININADTYFITERLREIDENYIIKYNTKTAKYEIHNLSQVDNTYALTLPYSELDERAVDYALKTRIENIDSIINEIDKFNDKV
jgi:hypothetical protein